MRPGYRLPALARDRAGNQLPYSAPEPRGFARFVRLTKHRRSAHPRLLCAASPSCCGRAARRADLAPPAPGSAALSPRPRGGGGTRPWGSAPPAKGPAEVGAGRPNKTRPRPMARQGRGASHSVPPGDSLGTAPAGCNVSSGAPGPWSEAVQRGHALQLSLLLGPPRIVTDVWVPRTPPVVTARTQSILCQQHPPLPLELKENPHERSAVQGQDRQWSSSDPLQQRAVVHTILLADRRPHCLVSTSPFLLQWPHLLLPAGLKLLPL